MLWLRHFKTKQMGVALQKSGSEYNMLLCTIRTQNSGTVEKARTREQEQT